MLIAAHLETQATRGKPESRLRAKWRLTQNLYNRGFTPKDVRQLYRFIDWIMVLPDELEVAFQEKL